MVTQKVTLTVPEELHRKMAKWRRRFNYSKVFQDALQEEFLKKERFAEKVAGDKSIKEIWEAGDESTPEGAFELGSQMGFFYAKTSPYAEIKEFEKYLKNWAKHDPVELERFSYDLDVMSILDRWGVIDFSKSKELTKLTKKDLKGATIGNWHSFDKGFMSGIMEFMQEMVESVGASLLVMERGKKMDKARDKKEPKRKGKGRTHIRSG